MDLHDYRDVAENYDRYLEVMYAHDDHHEHFQEFYLHLAQRYGAGGVVDVACGTGAVLLYLAERGIDVDGTDLSEEMCRVAAGKAAAMGLRLNIMPADMTVFSSGRKYSLAIIARSGFMHLPTQELQIRALTNLQFEEYNAEGEVIGTRVRPLLMRQTTRWEMHLLAKLCGFEVVDIYRGYHGDKEDLSDLSTAAKYRGNLIWILRRKD